MTLTFSRTTVCLVVAAYTLAACGGAATSNIAQTEPHVPGTYVALTSQASTTTSPLAGSTLLSNASSGQFNVRDTNGSVVRATDVVTLSDGQYLFTSTNGRDLTGGLQGAQGSTLLVNTGLGTDYDYAAVYNGTYTLNGVQYDALGVVGIPTFAGDIPSGGTATYTGKSSLTVVTENDLTHVYSDGTATVFVDFGNEQATITLDDFTVTDPIGIVANGAFDELEVANMTIDDAGFSGGTATFENDGQEVDIVGDNLTNATQGTLFGYDEDISAPDEVGGVVLVTGDTGQVTGAFIAD